jgi:hypothetical protein
MGANVPKRTIRTAAWFISVVGVVLVGLAYVTQVAFSQATPPPRPTPTGSDLSTPVRTTPTPNETPVRNTPTPIGTPVSNETPIRPTPTASTIVPPTARPKPEKDQPEATPIATPYLLPVSGVVGYAEGQGLELLAVLAGLGLVCWGFGVSIQRSRQNRRD